MTIHAIVWIYEILEEQVRAKAWKDRVCHSLYDDKMGYLWDGADAEADSGVGSGGSGFISCCCFFVCWSIC